MTDDLDTTLNQPLDPQVEVPGIGGIQVGTLPWLNISVAAIACYVAIAGIDEWGEFSSIGRSPAIEAIIACCCTPPVLSI